MSAGSGGNSGSGGSAASTAASTAGATGAGGLTGRAARVLVVDDEPLARSHLRALLEARGDVEVVGECGDGHAAVAQIRREEPELVLLDIQMPELDGLGVVREVGPARMPLVIFVTAYDEYALAAFEANAVAYLLKPVSEQRLQSVVERVQRLVGSRESGEQPARASALAGVRTRMLHHVLAVQKDGYALIALRDVCFFLVEDGVTHVSTANASFRTQYAIGDLESRLPTPPFFRAHRSTIANLEQVASISPLFKGALLLKMKDARGSEIQVSERQAKYVRDLLQL